MAGQIEVANDPLKDQLFCLHIYIADCSKYPSLE